MRVGDKESGVWVWQIDIRIDLKDRGVEITLVDIQTTELQVKQSEFMAESGEVGVVE